MKVVNPPGCDSIPPKAGKLTLQRTAKCVISIFLQKVRERIMEAAQLKSGIAELKARVENIRDWL
jgi:hypothetical protein